MRNCYQLEFFKKDAPSIFYKSTTDKKSFFNKNKRFVVTRHFEKHRGAEFYRVQELDTAEKVEGRFMRIELFAVENNVE